MLPGSSTISSRRQLRCSLVVRVLVDRLTRRGISVAPEQRREDPPAFVRAPVGNTYKLVYPCCSSDQDQSVLRVKRREHVELQASHWMAFRKGEHWLEVPLLGFEEVFLRVQYSLVYRPVPPPTRNSRVEVEWEEDKRAALFQATLSMTILNPLSCFGFFHPR